MLHQNITRHLKTFGLIWGCVIFLTQPLLGKAPLLTPLFQIQTDHNIQATAFTPDESVLAIATQKNQTTHVTLYSRQNAKPILTKKLNTSSTKQLQFSPVESLLAIRGQNHIEAVRFNDLSQNPRDSILQLQQKSDSELRFLSKGSSLSWATNSQILSIPVQTEPSSQIQWEDTSNLPISTITWNPQETQVAYSFLKDSDIWVASPQQNRLSPKLDYHQFNVVDLQFSDQDVLVSLDQQHNLFWGYVDQRIKSGGFTLKPMSDDEQSVAFHKLPTDYFILHTQNRNHQSFAYLVTSQGQVLLHTPTVGVASVAVSPTGKYIAIATGPQTLELYEFAQPLSPANYIRMLQKQEAYDMARKYQNHLDSPPSHIPSPPTPPSNEELQKALEKFYALETAGSFLEASELLKALQKKYPNAPELISAKKTLEEHQDLILLQEGRDLFEQGQLEAAIRTLVQIPSSSEQRSEARAMIKAIDQARQIESSLQHVITQINLKQWSTAEALLKKVLAKAPNHPKAQDLQEQIDEHHQKSHVEWILLSLGGLMLLLLTGGALFKYRERLIHSLSLKESWQEGEPHLKKPIRPTKQKAQTSPQEMEYFQETLEKTKQVLKTAQRMDTHQQHTGRLLDFEAEVAVIEKKAKHQTSLKPLTSQLLVILQTVRGLNFKKQQPEQPTHQQFASQQQKQQQQQPSSSESTPFTDHYELLGVTEAASQSEIKKAYHQKLKEYHPDRHQSTEFEWVKEQAEAMTRDLHTAYQTLSDPQKRKAFDQQRRTHS